MKRLHTRRQGAIPDPGADAHDADRGAAAHDHESDELDDESERDDGHGYLPPLRARRATFRSMTVSSGASNACGSGPV